MRRILVGFLCLALVCAAPYAALAERTLSCQTTMELWIGMNKELSITTNAEELGIASSDSNIVSVSGRTLTGVKMGVAVITITAYWNTETGPVTKTAQVNVTVGGESFAKDFSLNKDLKDEIGAEDGPVVLAIADLAMWDKGGLVCVVQAGQLARNLGAAPDGGLLVKTFSGQEGTVNAEYAVTIGAIQSVNRVLPEAGANLRTGPGMEYDVFDNLAAGTYAAVIGQDGPWSLLQNGDKLGYVWSELTEVAIAPTDGERIPLNRSVLDVGVQQGMNVVGIGREDAARILHSNIAELKNGVVTGVKDGVTLAVDASGEEAYAFFINVAQLLNEAPNGVVAVPVLDVRMGPSISYSKAAIRLTAGMNLTYTEVPGTTWGKIVSVEGVPQSGGMYFMTKEVLKGYAAKGGNEDQKAP